MVLVTSSIRKSAAGTASAAMKTPSGTKRCVDTCAVSKSKNGREMLTCTNCGSQIWAMSDINENVWIECRNISCGAQWDSRGNIEFAGFESQRKEL